MPGASDPRSLASERRSRVSATPHDLTGKLSETGLRGRRRSLRAALVGNALEWFDWTLYATFSTYLAANYFEGDDPTAGLLATLAVFAAGFIARPVGGYLFGHFGDRIGRRTTLILTMSMMAGASLLIAIVPSYGAIGIWASILLVTARLLQGLAHGGESGVAYTYVAELAPPDRRGLWSSSIYVSVTLGVMSATLLSAILTGVLPAAAMNDYGWRIGFVVGALLGLAALWLRRQAEESPVFEAVEERTDDDETLLSRGALVRAVIRIIGFSAACNATYYTWLTFAPSYAIAEKGMDQNGAFVAGVLAQLLMIALLPCYGWLSDRIGRRTLMVGFSIGVVIVPLPVLWMLDVEPWTLFLSQGLGLIVWAMMGSIWPILVTEQFPTRQRAVAVGLASSLTAALFGGTAPYLNTWLTSLGHPEYFQTYLMVLGVVALVTTMFVRETRGLDMREVANGTSPARLRTQHDAFSRDEPDRVRQLGRSREAEES